MTGGDSDRQLLARIREGDVAALDALLQRYWRPLVAYGFALVQSVDLAEDLVQDAFIRFWERRADWRTLDSARPILYRITRNLAFNRLRRLRLHERWLELVRTEEPAQGASAADELEVSELRQAIECAVAQLPRRRREVFTLAWFHGLSYQEIAELLGISRQTVANTVSAAHADLRRSLAGVRGAAG